MPQGVLPFQYAAERSSTGMTAMAGAGVYLDMMAAAGLWELVRRHVGIKGMSQMHPQKVCKRSGGVPSL